MFWAPLVSRCDLNINKCMYEILHCFLNLILSVPYTRMRLLLIELYAVYDGLGYF